ncbi:MAG: MFS transporter [Frankiales bacterium]|nr:MFS transporter [Frankiales bacterium]
MPREVFILSIVSFCVALGFGIVGPALPIFADEFGVTDLQASAVVSVFAAMRLVGALPAGWLVDRVGERTTLATGLIIVALSSALAGLSGTYVQLIVLRGVGGIGSAMFTVSSLALLLRIVGPDQRGRAANAFQGGFLIGGVVSPAIGGVLLVISIRLPFFFYAVTLAVAAFVVIVLMAHTHLRERVRKAAPSATGRGSWALLAEALRNRSYVTALTVNLGNGFASFGLRSAIIPLFVVNGLGLDKSWAGWGAFASALVQFPFLVRAGRLSDTRGRRLALMIGTGVTTAGFVVLALTGQWWGYLAAMGVLGAGAAFLGAGPSAVVGDVTQGRREGPVVATFQMMSDVGAVAGPLIAGLIVTSTGSYSVGFVVGAVVLALTFVMSATMPETLRRAEARELGTPATGEAEGGQTPGP